MIIDRTIAPQVEFNHSFEFLKAQTENLKNGIPFHFINHAEQDILRLQFVFDAGIVFQRQKLIASSVSNMITNGTKRKTAKEVAEYIENRGVFVETGASYDSSHITVYCLTKQLKEILPLIIEIIEEANFPEQEINDHLHIQKQKFIVNSQKVGFVARNEFTTLLVGKDNPYANKIELADYDEVSRNTLIDFFKTYYRKGKLEVYASGKVNEDVINLINGSIGSIEIGNHQQIIRSQDSSTSEKKILIDKPDALQTAIRIGKEIISKSHKDFPALFFLNTVLGGYFGSRLMTNIREDKGYTYGISSGLINHKGLAYFTIATEVGSEFVPHTMEEIEKELENLSKFLISDEELNTVKNYIMGSIMRSFDGAFSAMDRFISIRTLDLDYGYYTNLIKQISNIEPHYIRKIAQEYLQFDSMKIILVGKL